MKITSEMIKAGDNTLDTLLNIALGLEDCGTCPSSFHKFRT